MKNCPNEESTGLVDKLDMKIKEKGINDNTNVRHWATRKSELREQLLREVCNTHRKKCTDSRYPATSIKMPKE